MGSESTDKKSVLNTKLGMWRPDDTGDTRQWLRNLIKEVDIENEPLNPTLQEFKDLIESDTMIFLLFNYMFLEVPNKEPYIDDPTGQKQVRDYKHMLDLFNKIMKTAPKWLYKTEGQQSLIMLPITAILDWPMGTASGQAAFLHPEVNKQFCKMLKEWSKFLTGEASRAVLESDPEGWFSEEALHALEEVAAVGSPPPFKSFGKQFQCNPDERYFGFKSWDDFFTRQFRAGVRPVAAPDDEAVVVNACESAMLSIYPDVKRSDKFWVKDQPYSVEDMLAGDKYASLFVGGTIYQALLTALSYHRWHSPVSGTVVKVHYEPGTYFAESLWEGFRLPSEDGKPHPDGQPHLSPDREGFLHSQKFMSHVNTRAMIYIQADNPDIGLMCIMPVGMVEVSSCEVTVHKFQHVKKGDQLGSFHFGGSTHCLFFQRGVNIDFIKKGPYPLKHNNAVCSELAVVGKCKSPIYQAKCSWVSSTILPCFQRWLE